MNTIKESSQGSTISWQNIRVQLQTKITFLFYCSNSLWYILYTYCPKISKRTDISIYTQHRRNTDNLGSWRRIEQKTYIKIERGSYWVQMPMCSQLEVPWIDPLNIWDSVNTILQWHLSHLSSLVFCREASDEEYILPVPFLH